MKKISLSIVLVVLASALTTFFAAASNKTVLFHEDFNTLENWKAFFFPKISRHSVYTIERANDKHYLKAESNASASAILYKESFQVCVYSRVRWRWKVRNLFVNGNPRTKAGDDYPIRIYIVFPYDPEKAGVFEKLTYGWAKKLYGEYPPDSSLSYVWANKADPETVVTSPYTGRAKIILLEKGPDKVGRWVDEEINVVEDYRRAFGKDPPERASIAVMNDSDNTGESSVSYLEYLEVFR